MKSRRFLTLSVLLILGVLVGQQAFSEENQTFPFIHYLLLQQKQKEVTKLIDAKQGGSLKLKGISIDFPPDALNEDTEITFTSVDVSQFDGNTVTLGGVNNLHIIGAVFEPVGTVLNIPAIVHFSLPHNWTQGTEIVVFAATGNDPLEVLETTQEITITGTPGAYIAEIRLSHFSIFNISRICHEGTVNNTVKKFRESNAACTEEQIKAQVLGKYGVRIDPKDAKKMGPENIQAFLGTYFDALGSSYNGGEDISADTIDYLKEQARAGRQVVIAFSHVSSTWPDKEGEYDFYRSFPHTATLEYHMDNEGHETFLVRHTLSHGGFMGDKLTRMQTAMGGKVISYTDPLDNINVFRNTQNGVIFKKYVQEHFPGQFPDSFFNIFPSSYKLAKVYIDRRDDSTQNPCDLKLKDRQNCLCGCNLPGTQFWCSYDTEDMGWSPSCRDLNNGPCICKAYGCVRMQPVTSGECYDNCMDQYGI